MGSINAYNLAKEIVQQAAKFVQVDHEQVWKKNVPLKIPSMDEVIKIAYGLHAQTFFRGDVLRMDFS